MKVVATNPLEQTLKSQSKITKAVIYARVSSDLQHKEGTIQSQIVELEKQVHSAGDKLIKEYIDDGYSGALLDRPAMNELRVDLKKNKFDAIYIINTDRIARDVTYQNIIVGEILRYKKQLIINGKDYVHNPENKFTLTVLGAVAELERAKLIERVMRGRQHRLRQGMLMGNGYKTFGYTYIRKQHGSPPQYEINETEAKIVRHIFETYAKGGIGIRTIATRLARKSPQRNKLGQVQIKHILKNIMYTGTRYLNMMTMQKPGDVPDGTKPKLVLRDKSEWVGIPVPQIIPKKLYDKVQKRLAYNRECYRNSKHMYPLSGLVLCGTCKTRCRAYRRTYKLRSDHTDTVYERAVYKCNGTRKKCHNPEVNGTALGSIVFELVQNATKSPVVLQEHIPLFKQTSTRSSRHEQLLKGIEQKKNTVTARKDRIVDLYASGELGRELYIEKVREYDKALTELATQKEQLLKYTLLFQQPDNVQQSLSEYCAKVQKDATDCTTDETKRRFFTSYVEKVQYVRKCRGRVQVKVCGLISIQLVDGDQQTTVSIEYTLTKKLNRKEYQLYMPKHMPRTQYHRATLSTNHKKL